MFVKPSSVWSSVAVVGALGFATCVLAPLTARAQDDAAAPLVADVKATYANVAAATYADALATAKQLKMAIDTLVSRPSEETLAAARAAWKAARVPYMQTEAYRFGNPIVDDWEGRVNAWPLDEGLIDYVDGGSYGADNPENTFYVANVVANPTFEAGGKKIDATTITKTLLQDDLQEAGGVEANVATGYHAIEFLLWGQDLNGTGPGAGNRPATDFDTNNCTNGNCDRRAAFLSTATDLLIDDLVEMADNWKADGAARAAITNAADIKALSAMLTGLGSLSYGEMAGERIKLGLLLHDPEEEHDCFSDNTHNSHYYDLLGIQNVYLGRYVRVDGSTVTGASLSDVIAAKDPALDQAIKAAISDTLARAQVMKTRAETVEAYDQMIGEGNAEGNAVVRNLVDGLVAQTKQLEKAVAALNLTGITFEGSDSLDNPNAVGAN